MSGVSEPANRLSSGPVLSPGFLLVLDHSAAVEIPWTREPGEGTWRRIWWLELVLRMSSSSF